MVHYEHLLDDLLLAFDASEKCVKNFFVLVDVLLEVVRTILSSC